TRSKRDWSSDVCSSDLASSQICVCHSTSVSKCSSTQVWAVFFASATNVVISLPLCVVPNFDNKTPSTDLVFVYWDVGLTRLQECDSILGLDPYIFRFGSFRVICNVGRDHYSFKVKQWMLIRRWLPV